MSEAFHFWRQFNGYGGAQRDRMTVEPDVAGFLAVTVSEAAEDGLKRYAIIHLPASDARRLRDWLNERYPEETTNG